MVVKSNSNDLDCGALYGTVPYGGAMYNGAEPSKQDCLEIERGSTWNEP